MAEEHLIRTYFLKSIEQIIGFNAPPLGGIPVEKDSSSILKNSIAHLLLSLLEEEEEVDFIEKDILARLKQLAEEAEQCFLSFYSSPENYTLLRQKWQEFETARDDESRARILTEIWLPEITLEDDAILKRWRLSQVEANPHPIRPDEVTIQLNALYTMPEELPASLPKHLAEEWEGIKSNLNRIADYDHPVSIFADDASHELITCLTELDRDIAFEKERGVLPKDHKLLVLISISVTHDRLDTLATHWIEWLLREKRFGHLSYLLLSEAAINNIKKKLLKKDIPVFSVFGKYAKHFNALKYTQLILEKGYGIRAGFKLDTDEGIRSEDLHHARGRTWFQILCHDLWGGTGVDCHGREVELGINEGEYIKGTDIDEFGYAASLRMPEVKYPPSFISSSIFFNKPFAQARGTELYNRFDRLDDHISHPLVKGGGYGISNDALRRFTPFTLSEVGRAEDQQFYFYGLTKGLRGIFHPDLRIAHYKSTVATSERKTAATRLLGDMYRLIIFEHLVSLMGVKDDIDPFPGIFAGGLARAQAFFTLLYRAYEFCTKGEEENARFLLSTGIDELEELKEEIASGKIKVLLEEEALQWKEFVDTVERLEADEVRSVLDDMII